MFARSRKNKPIIIQAYYHRRRRGVARSVHIMAFIVACVTGALAFSLPVERIVTLPEVLDKASVFERIQPQTLDTEDWLTERQPLDLTPLAEPEPADDGWKTVVIQSGDTLSHIFSRLGLSNAELLAVLDSGREARALERLQPGQKLKLHIDLDRQCLQELVLATSRTSGLRFLRDGQRFVASPYQHDLEKQTVVVTGIIRSNFQAAAIEAGLPRSLNQRIIRLFEQQVNFSRDLQPNDYFTVVYQHHYFEDRPIRPGDILAVELVLSGRSLQLIGFPDAQGKMRYFTPEGESLNPAFIRYPVNYHRVSSPFAPNRLHPILGIRRPHNGIDLAAPSGTPIHAASDGVVQFVGRRGGYGRTIIINHGRGYSTLYAHLSSYAHGLSAGNRVERGQFIGRVGQSGTATGPHLHYEVHVNSRPHNPATVELPGYPPLSGRSLAEFKAHAQPLLVQIAQNQPNQDTRIARND